MLLSLSQHNTMIINYFLVKAYISYILYILRIKMYFQFISEIRQEKILEHKSHQMHLR